MVAGYERYFQIAHCARDEDVRADRQPEFTQLDFEMSFVEEEDILSMMEEMFTGLTRAVRPDLRVVTPFPRMTYHEAIRRYGSDKPDLRYGMELFDITDLAADSEFAVFRNAAGPGGAIEGICVEGGADLSRKDIDTLTTFVQGYGAKGLVSIALLGEGALDALTIEDVRSPVAKYLSSRSISSAGPLSDRARSAVTCSSSSRARVASEETSPVRRTA
jgi:aspartyl-tRNA synthetase